MTAGPGVRGTVAPPQLHRDRMTRLVYAQLGVYAFFLYAFSPAVSLLREEQDVSRAVSGLHVTALAVGSVVAGLVSDRGALRLGRATMLRAGMVGTCVGGALFCATTALPVTLLGALVAGSFGSIIASTHSPVLTDHHRLAGPAAVSEANALAAGLGVVAPLLVGATAALGDGWWRLGLLMVVPLAAGVLLYSRGVSMPPAPGASAGAATTADRRLPRRFWATWAMVVLFIAVEFSMAIWASDLLRERVGVSDATAAAGVTAVLLGMTVGRLAGAPLSLRLPVDTILLGTLMVTFAGFAVFWASTDLVLSLAGLVVVGAGVGLQFPLGIARLIAASGGRPDLASARMSLGAGLAIGVAPFALGALADSVGTHRAYLLVPVLVALATVLLLVTRARAARHA